MTNIRLSIITSCYKGESYLPGFFANLEEQTIFAQAELVLVLNDPTPAEQALAEEFSAQHPGQVQIHCARPVESLGASWNRAWRAARGEYVCAWNIDDRRLPDSLARQVAALDADPSAAICYGDYLTVPAPGETRGPRSVTPPFDPAAFARECWSGGAFMLWRRAAIERMAGFDEQLRCAVDYDFTVRWTLIGLTMLRVDGLLGYFTDAQSGLSTRGQKRLLDTEKTLVQLRYGIFDKVRREFLPDAAAYRSDALLINGRWHPLEEWIPDYPAFLAARQPLWEQGKIRHRMRRALSSFGLFELAVRMRDRLGGRVR